MKPPIVPSAAWALAVRKMRPAPDGVAAWPSLIRDRCCSPPASRGPIKNGRGSRLLLACPQIVVAAPKPEVWLKVTSAFAGKSGRRAAKRIAASVRGGRQRRAPRPTKQHATTELERFE